MSLDHNWIVYLVRCADQSLYCGVTNDLRKRLQAHNNGNGAKYTRSRRPVVLVGMCKNVTRSGALKLERLIKKLPANRKLEQLKKGKEILRMINNAKIKREIQSLAANIIKLSEKIDAIATSILAGEQLIDPAEMPAKETKQTPKKKKASSTIANIVADSGTVSKVVLGLIKDAPDGISTAALLKATGFDKRKLHNATFRLKKAGIIKSVRRGIYQSV